MKHRFGLGLWLTCGLLPLCSSMTRPGRDGNFAWTNDAITSCARDNRASGVPWLTLNNQSYICTDAQFDAFYDPATSIAYASQNEGENTPFALSCPMEGQSIRCFVFSSWGQVAGGPDACTDTCSVSMLEGEQSCCAKACVGSSPSMASTTSPADGKGGVTATGNCTNQSWVNDVTGDCGSAFSGGYCDCCPDCYSCVHGGEDDFPHPTPTSASSGRDSKSEDLDSSLEHQTAAQAEFVVQRRRLFDNAFCDCRSGLEVSPDYSPCWNSCLDCLGDDGIIAYMPADVAEACVGKEECFVMVLASDASDSGTNDWFACDSTNSTTCTKTSEGPAVLPDSSKVKMAALCA